MRSLATNLDRLLKQKVELLEDYFRQFGINSVVFGMSGGVDSAVVGGILRQCESLQRVIAIAAPIFSNGATNQDVAGMRAIRQAQAFNMEVWNMDLTSVQLAYEQVMRLSPSKAKGDRRVWADGQILSIARTPLFYGVAAHLQAEGFRSLVAGTTNRSEGSYIGFYGKGSDGMNDIQPISDLWKSEVYALAKHLNVLPEILNEKPRGDVWDARCDEEMIGASYDQLESYLEYKIKYLAEIKYGVLNANPNKMPGAEAIERIHKTNLHKYLVGSPGVHFDVLERHVPGGWSEANSFTHRLGVKYA